MRIGAVGIAGSVTVTVPVTPEINATQRSRDVDMLRRFDRKPQDRHESAQRLEFGI